MLKSTCSVCGNEKSRFVKKQEAKGILYFLGIKTTLSKIPVKNTLIKVPVLV